MPVTPVDGYAAARIYIINQPEKRVLEGGVEAARELDCNPIAPGGLMATPNQNRTGNPSLFVAYALIALSLWMVDREVRGRSSPPISVVSSPETASSGSPHGEIVASFIVPQNDKLYRPASSVLDQLASDESSSAEDNEKGDDKRHRAALALMVYLSADGIKR